MWKHEHYKTATIILPTFETQKMAKKTARKIRSKTVRAMMGLSFYTFRGLNGLTSYCKKIKSHEVLWIFSDTSPVRLVDFSDKENRYTLY
ncbi:MAG: hypothetical protein D3921_01805 [Candidatus Electrothrix sp. AW1]|jgi:hypothetical protein|nr:hypothetical protein [Candidatus Electrothrix sp. AX1]MCI5181260.1 hypothetical protein [Candidatus Electrothrix gigas]